MVEVAHRATESLLGVRENSEVFQMPAIDAKLLDFAILNIEKRVKALQEKINGCYVEPARTPAAATVACPCRRLGAQTKPAPAAFLESW
jgi:hypothetical protein